MLIASPRHTDEDLRVWTEHERWDADRAWTPLMDRRIESAVEHIIEFARRGQCYAGVSWGKDSVTLAGLIAASGLDIPLVWVRVEPTVNPDCVFVRDAFLKRFPGVRYDEFTIWCRHHNGKWIKHDRKHDGFYIASEVHAYRYISGIRSEESRTRKMREALHGVATERTCAPITRWSGADVFAYLHRSGLPVHPAYACTFGGTLDRTRLRVGSLTGKSGGGRGRREWEWAYYRDELIALGETAVVR